MYNVNGYKEIFSNYEIRKHMFNLLTCDNVDNIKEYRDKLNYFVSNLSKNLINKNYSDEFQIKCLPLLNRMSNYKEQYKNIEYIMTQLNYSGLYKNIGYNELYLNIIIQIKSLFSLYDASYIDYIHKQLISQKSIDYDLVKDLLYNCSYVINKVYDLIIYYMCKVSELLCKDYESLNIFVDEYNLDYYRVAIVKEVIAVKLPVIMYKELFNYDNPFDFIDDLYSIDSLIDNLSDAVIDVDRVLNSNVKFNILNIYDNLYNDDKFNFVFVRKQIDS